MSSIAEYEGLLGFVVGVLGWRFYLEYMKETISVSELYIYPVKSCRGIRVNQAKLVKTGLEYDRILMLVHQDGKFLTQRRCSQMAQVQQKIHEASKLLELNAPNMPSIKISLVKQSQGDENSFSVKVWDDVCEVVEADQAASQWFSQFLQQPVKLVRMSNSFVRKTCPEYAPNGQTAFPDGFPMLLASQEGLDDLNTRLPAPITMERFRPNIVVKGCKPFEEDTWSKIQFLASDRKKIVDINVVKPCSRCTVPNLDPVTGASDGTAQPTVALKSFRTGKSLSLPNEKWKKEVRVYISFELIL